MLAREDKVVITMAPQLTSAAFCSLFHSHHRLGQSPPKGFRTWKLSNITDYVVNLQSRMPLLQRAILLHAQLGQSRVDMSMVDWSNGQLEAHTASLAAQVTHQMLLPQERHGRLHAQ